MVLKAVNRLASWIWKSNQFPKRVAVSHYVPLYFPFLEFSRKIIREAPSYIVAIFMPNRIIPHSERPTNRIPLLYIDLLG
jgi:hypothetical protein